MLVNAPNRWLLTEDEGRLRYMSDQYNGRILGYEERDGVVLADTPSRAICLAGVGGAIHNFECDLPEDFRFHVRRSALNLSGYKNIVTAAHCAMLSMASQANAQLYLGVSTQTGQAGLKTSDYIANGTLIDDFAQQLKISKANLAEWDKSLFVNAVMLALSNDQMNVSQPSADGYYASMIMALRDRIFEITEDPIEPIFSVIQQSGTADSGLSNWILAETTLDVAHPTFRITIATPTYPYPIIPHSARRLTERSASIVAELSALAISELRQGREWFCPSPVLAMLKGKELTVRFRAMNDLVLDGNHGFDVVSDTGNIVVKNIQVRGKYAVLQLDKQPQSPVLLRYAFGKSQSREGFHANFGGIRDSFGQASILAPGHTLRRWALSREIPVEQETHIKELSA